MIKSLSTIIVSTLLAFGVSAFAANTVVVIPLNTCSGGLTNCSGKCVDTNNDPTYCSDCTTQCGANEYCDNGICTSKCPSGLTDCSGQCVDTMSNPSFCGDCTTDCGEEQYCYKGTCKSDAGTACTTHDECTAFCIANVCTAGKIVFVSSAEYNGNLGGLTGADSKCQGLAEAAGLSGIYKAWLSNASESPSTRFIEAPVPYYTVGIQMIANDWDDLTDGSIIHEIDKDEKGDSGLGAQVWTGTTPSGTLAGPLEVCQGWESVNSSNRGRQGLVNTGGTSHSWTYWSTNGCDKMGRLYCFQQ